MDKKEYMKEYRKKNKEKINELKLCYEHNVRFGGMRDLVLERDNWQCQECGMTNEQHIIIFGSSITIDHINGGGRDNKIPNNNLDNLRTLCRRCHGKKDHRRLKSAVGGK